MSDEYAMAMCLLICFTVMFCVVEFCNAWIKVEQARKQREVKADDRTT